MSVRRQFHAHIGFLALALMFLASCSNSKDSELSSVTGKVLYQDKPLKGVLVTLHLPGDEPLSFIPPSGLTKEDGTYSIMTGEAPGAAPGEYVVTFMCSEEVKAPGGQISLAMGPVYEDRFKGALADKTKSKHKVEIKPGANQLEPFHLQ